MGSDKLMSDVRKAVAHFWKTRRRQSRTQKKRRAADQGSRGAVTGGAQMDGFIKVLTNLVRSAGAPDVAIFRDKALELPGFFRPTKKWDLLVVSGGGLLAVIEVKSQVGPSFGNNFNNRTEEAIGSATDLWTAFREGAFGDSPRPWLGYLFILEDCPRSRSPVKVAEPHFDVFAEFKEASYMRRYELLCRKLVRERLYEAVAFLAAAADTGVRGEYTEPATDLSIANFAAALAAHVGAFAAMRRPRRDG